MKKIICCLATLAVAFGALSALTFVKANAETTPAFKGVSVSLNKDIVLKFEVENYTDGYTLTFNYKGTPYNGEVKDGVAEFAYVTPQYLGETVTATIYDGENKVAETKKSVKEYLYELIRAKKTDKTYETMPCEQFVAMKTLAVDMLYYGAAAQTKYLEKDSYTLVNADLTTEEAALATKFEAPDNSAQATLSGEKAGYEWVSAGIRFDYNVSLYFVIKPLTENAVLKLKVTDKDGNNEVIDKYIVENGTYKYRYENVNVVDFANKYTVKVLDEENKEIGQTLSYSVNTYVLNMHADSEMKDITQAVYNYGVSAAKYNAAATSTAHLYDSLSFDGEAIAYVGEDFDLTAYTLNKVCSVCGHKEAVAWDSVDYTKPDTIEKGAKTVTLTVGNLSTEITVKVYEKIVTPEEDIIKFGDSGWAGWAIEFDRQDLSATAGYSSTKGYLPNDFVERIEYIICKDETTELGSIYLAKNGSNGCISDVNNTYEVSANLIGNMYATTDGEGITQKWSNLVWLALRNDFETGATYKVKAKVIAKEGTYYADSEAYMTNSTFTTVEPVYNTTNLKKSKIVKEVPTNVEKDFYGYELVGGASLEEKAQDGRQHLTVRQEGSYYSTACMIVGDKVTFYIYSSVDGEAKIILNTASGDTYRDLEGSGDPNGVREVILKNSFSVKLNGTDLVLNDSAKAEAYRQDTGSWDVCRHFAETELATVTVKKGWNAIQFVYEKGAQANLGDIRFEFVA